MIGNYRAQQADFLLNQMKAQCSIYGCSCVGLDTCTPCALSNMLDNCLRFNALSNCIVDEYGQLFPGLVLQTNGWGDSVASFFQQASIAFGPMSAYNNSYSQGNMPPPPPPIGYPQPYPMPQPYTQQPYPTQNYPQNYQQTQSPPYFGGTSPPMSYTPNGTQMQQSTGGFAPAPITRR